MMQWKPDSRKFLGERLVLEGITVLTVFFDAAGSRRYVIYGYMPLIVSKEDKYHDTIEAAKAMAERRFSEYIARLHAAIRRSHGEQ